MAACVFNRAGIKYDILTGYLEEPYVWNEIENWIDAVRAVQGMRNNRMGILGHYYCGMLDVYTDITRQSFTFGLPGCCNGRRTNSKTSGIFHEV